MFGLYWSRGRREAEGEKSGIFWWDGLLMLIFYTGYVALVVVGNLIFERNSPPEFDEIGRKKSRKSYYIHVRKFNSTINRIFP